ncbi:MAG: hypothetical protein WC712_05765 [Candidatus Brocadiia bacterium]
MYSRWPRFLFYFFLSLLTVALMYLLLQDNGIAAGAKSDSWESAALYKLAKYLDDNPLVIVVFLGIIALAEMIVALMYLATPPAERMVRYSTGENEVLVNLDSIAASLCRTVESENDIHGIRLKLRVPPGKQLHIHCFIRLELEEQPDIPRRVEQIIARIRTHFEQSLPLEAKFTTSLELEIRPAVVHQERPTRKVSAPISQESDEFQGPRYPIEQ